MSFKIVHHVDECIGCGACVSACPDNWAMDDETGKSKPKKTEVKESGCNQAAVDVCPVQCIELVEENG